MVLVKIRWLGSFLSSHRQSWFINLTKVTRNYNHFTKWDSVEPYKISEPFLANASLTGRLFDTLKAKLDDDRLIIGQNATADSFYSSQGRLDTSFLDDNQTLIESLIRLETSTLEMESGMLLHLANCCNHSFQQAKEGHRGQIYAAACAMIFADRKTGAFIDPLQVEQLETSAGQAILDALVSWVIPAE